MTGFESVRSPDGLLIAVAGRLDELRRLELDRVGGWIERLRSPARGVGRGTTAVLKLEDGGRLRLKQLRLLRRGVLGLVQLVQIQLVGLRTRHGLLHRRLAED